MKRLLTTLMLLCSGLAAQALAQPSVTASNVKVNDRELAPMTLDSERFKRLVAFHGHSCAGLAIGVRVSQAAIRELGGNIDPYNLVAIVETNRCPVDAIQVLMHTTAGKQNLIYERQNRNVFTFVRRSDGKAIRITVKEDGWGKTDPTFEALRQKKISGKATAEEAKKFDQMMDARAAAILAAPEDQLLTIEWVKVPIPTGN